MKRFKAKLNVKSGVDDETKRGTLHMRPATYIVKMCSRGFPNTDFRILRDPSDKKPSDADSGGVMGLFRGFFGPKGSGEVDPKSIMSLCCGQFLDGEEVTVQVTGKLEAMASDFFKVVWENLGEVGGDFPGNRTEREGREKAEKERIAALVDQVFSRIQDADIEALSAMAPSISREEDSATAQQCRSVATINDRLHDVSLAVLPRIAKHFQSKLQIAFEVPPEGIFTFAFQPDSTVDNDIAVLTSILGLGVEIGTRITVLTEGPDSLRANEVAANVLRNLWQCDAWLRARGGDLESSETMVELIEFVDCVAKQQGSDHDSIRNPSLGALLTPEHVFVNPAQAEMTKGEALNQLAALHARKHGLQISLVLHRLKAVELRNGFAIAHAAVDRTPRISITFGVYRGGVAWDRTGKRVELVAMVVFARDTYGTWLAYLQKVARLFRAQQDLQKQLVTSRTPEEFLSFLRQSEKAMFTQGSARP